MKIILSKAVALKVNKETARMCQTLASVPGLKGFETFVDDEAFNKKLEQAEKDLKGTKVVEQKKYLRVEYTNDDIIFEISDNMVQEFAELQHKIVTAAIPVIGAVKVFQKYVRDVQERFDAKWDQEGGLE